MSEQLAREQRRHLKRAIGETATAAMGETRQLVAQVSLAQQALARELQAVEAKFPDDVAKLHQRIDGVAAWCEQTEGAVQRLHDRLTELSDVVVCLDLAADVQAALSRWQRLQWLWTGRLPARPRPFAVKAPAMAEPVR